MNIKRYIDKRVHQLLHLDGVVTQYYIVLRHLYETLNGAPRISNDLNRAMIRCRNEVSNALDGFLALKHPNTTESRNLQRNPRVIGGDVVVWSNPTKSIWGKIMGFLGKALIIMRDYEDEFTLRGYAPLFRDITGPIRDVLISMQRVKPA